MRFEEVATGVFVATSRRFATTTTLIADRSGEALIVDPAWDPEELAAIVDDVGTMGVTVTAGFSTHSHYDHVLWHPGLGDVPRFGSPATVRVVEEHYSELLAMLGPDWPQDLAQVFGKLEALDDSSQLDLTWASGADNGSTPSRVEVLIHNAHAEGHCALWLEGPRVLVAGDMLSDIELPIAADDDLGLASYLEALDRLGVWVRQADVVIPGHGAPSIDPMQRLDADRRYVESVLARGRYEDPRLANSGMPEVDEQNRLIARSQI